ncbi:MAG: N-acetyltransferase [Archangium sp.]|nr:N-acetyltransferase [Archangium sp.]
MATGLKVNHEVKGHRSAFFLEKDGQRIAEMTMSRVNDHTTMIDHTEVSDTLRGQGAGRELLNAAVEWARKENQKFIPVCPFAKAQFDKDASIGDVLSK